MSDKTLEYMLYVATLILAILPLCWELFKKGKKSWGRIILLSALMLFLLIFGKIKIDRDGESKSKMEASLKEQKGKTDSLIKLIIAERQDRRIFEAKLDSQLHIKYDEKSGQFKIYNTKIRDVENLHIGDEFK